MTASDIGMAAAIYVAGACCGALFFGQLTDRFGRKKLFMLTLAVYLLATVATAFAFAPWYFFICRFFAGAGIGGEYAAINSAIDELIPARNRGQVDITINGSYWVGAAIGALAAVVAPQHLDLPGRPRLAAVVRDGRDPRHRDPHRAPPRAREPALAVHPRPGGGGRADRRRDRGERARRDAAGARRARQGDDRPPARDDPVPGDRQGRLPALPARARSSASRSSSGRRFSTTRSRSTSGRSSASSSTSRRAPCRTSS